MARKKNSAPAAWSAAKHGIQQSLFHWTGILESHYNSAFVREMRPRRVTVSRFRTLAVLMEVEAITINKLAQLAMIERTAVSRLLAQMGREGLIARQRKPGDRRASEIRITPKGRQAFHIMWPARFRVRSRAMQGIDPARVRAMMQTIREMIANLEEYEATGNGNGAARPRRR
jgi:MarR family transcriptional regulator, organic hydroperoxide resistance regulator